MRWVLPILLILPQIAQAARDLCDSAAHHAARETGVPVEILLAITRTETRHGDGPWPWTINHQGQGHWFDTKDQAVQSARGILALGETADLGCFQLNSRWHAAAFDSPETMLDPVQNALHAARFLRGLKAEFGSWPPAIAAYHSRDRDRGAAYLARVEAAMPPFGAPPSDAAPSVAQRTNRFPLLQAGSALGLASLVPQGGAAQPLVTAP